MNWIDPDGRIQKHKNGTIDFYPIGEKEVITGNSGKTITVQYGYILANDGTKIKARYNYSRDVKSENFDCHGLTFTDGMLWIDNSEVEALLKADRYEKVNNNPSPGNVMIQKNRSGKIIHSATVVAVNANKNTVKVREAIGSMEFKLQNGKLTRVIEQEYKINDFLEFYKRPEDKIIKCKD